MESFRLFGLGIQLVRRLSRLSLKKKLCLVHLLTRPRQLNFVQELCVSTRRVVLGLQANCPPSNLAFFQQQVHQTGTANSTPLLP